jgi:hypothetical protein
MLGDTLIFTHGAFSVPATFHPKGLPPRTVQGIYDDPSIDAAPGQQIAETTDPTFRATWAEVRDIPDETPLEINGGKFSVMRKKPDYATGQCVVLLSHGWCEEEED